MPQTHYIHLHLKADTLDRFDLPDIGYPVPMDRVDQLVVTGDLQFVDMFFWIQDYSADSCEEWLDYEPAMLRLSEIIMPGGAPEKIAAEGDDWQLLLAPVDLSKEIITIQRDNFLIAALQDHGDGHLVASAYRPLDTKSTGYLRDLSAKPAPNGTVRMRPSNWEYALDCSAGMGNMYAAERGESYLSYWKYGLGINNDGSKTDTWYLQRDVTPILSKYTAMQIGLSYERSEEAS